MSLEEEIRGLSPVAAHALACKLTWDIMEHLTELYALCCQSLSTVFLITSCSFLGAEITDDIEIQELTRADLNELLPGVQHFKLRKKISELINKSKQVGIAPVASKATVPLFWNHSLVNRTTMFYSMCNSIGYTNSPVFCNISDS